MAFSWQLYVRARHGRVMGKWAFEFTARDGWEWRTEQLFLEIF